TKSNRSCGCWRYCYHRRTRTSHRYVDWCCITRNHRHGVDLSRYQSVLGEGNSGRSDSRRCDVGRGAWTNGGVAHEQFWIAREDGHVNSTIPRARDLNLIPSWPARVFPNHEWVLLLVLFFEIAVFSITGDNFFTAA